MQTQEPKTSYKFVRGQFGQFKIPQDWAIKPIKELGHVITGSTPETVNRQYYGVEHPWATPTDLGKRKYIDRTTTMLSSKGLDACRRIPKKSVLVVCIGSTIGKIGIAAKEMATNQQINSIVCEESDSEFVYYQLLHNQQKIKNIANHVAVPILNKTDFGILKIAIPTNAVEQRKIASILSKVDDLIQKTDEIIDQTKRLRKVLVERLVTIGVSSPKTRRVELVIGRPQPISNDWNVMTLEQCRDPAIPITYGIVQPGPNIPDGVPFIRTADIKDERIVLDGLLCTSKQIANEYKRSEVRAGDLICAIRATVGVVLQVPDELDGANLNRGFARIVPSSSMSERFLFWALKSDYVKRQFALATKGTTFPNITLADLRKIRLAIPSKSEQDKIAGILDRAESKVLLEKRLKERLLVLKKGLMQKLLTGQIRVKV